MRYFGRYFGGLLSAPTPGTTSSLFAFNPTVASFVEDAFERCGVDPASLTVRHAVSARRSLGFLFAEWDSKDVKLFNVDEQTQTVTEGAATYATLDGTIAILDMMVRRDGTDTPVMPMSRSEYASIPTKTTEGLPTRFYFERILSPTYTLWQVPENSTDVIHYWRLQRLSDVGDPSSNLDVTHRWFDALTAGLAAKLAVKFAPMRRDMLKAEALEAFSIANLGERERGDLRMSLA